MIILNCGMPKSATTLVGEYQMDIVRLARPQNGIEQVHDLGYMQSLNRKKVNAVHQLSARYGDLVVKTHAKPSFWSRRLIARGGARATFCFRDPRDTMLSVIDHGVRTRQGLDGSGAFAEIHTLADAVSFAKASIGLYYAWQNYGKALFICYEALMRDKVEHLSRMATYFGYACKEEALRSIYEKHEVLKKQAWNFNTGEVERWRREMEPEWVVQCERLFGDDLVAMGYERN